MKQTLLILCLAVLLSCAQRPLRKGLAETQSVPDFIIPMVNLENVSVFDAVSFLRCSEEQRGQTSKTFLSRGITPRTVSIKGDSMTYLAVLNEICAQANLEWTATPKQILIHEKEQRIEHEDR